MYWQKSESQKRIFRFRKWPKQSPKSGHAQDSRQWITSAADIGFEKRWWWWLWLWWGWLFIVRMMNVEDFDNDVDECWKEFSLFSLSLDERQRVSKISLLSGIHNWDESHISSSWRDALIFNPQNGSKAVLDDVTWQMRGGNDNDYNVTMAKLIHLKPWKLWYLLQKIQFSLGPRIENCHIRNVSSVQKG